MNQNFYVGLKNDLNVANDYKSKGEDNKSRVVARQVAGKALKSLMIELGIKIPNSTTPYQILLFAKDHTDLFSPILPELLALTRKVNFDYSFPEDLNLIEYSKNIIDFVKDYNK